MLSRTSGYRALVLARGLALGVTVTLALPALATTFDGDADGPLGPFNWGTAANWTGNVLPLFNGTEVITVNAGGVNFPTPPAGGTDMNLGGNRSMSRLDIGGVSNTGGRNLIIDAANPGVNTITLTSTTSSASTAGAQLLLRSSDNAGVIFNNNFVLDGGAPGSYTAFWRQQNNAGFDNEVNGTITQGAGQSWTLDWSRNSARGDLRLNNGGNSISTIRSSSGTVIIGAVGAAGGADLVFNGGGFSWVGDRFTNAITNNISFTNNGGVSGDLRWTGNISQSARVLTQTGSNSILRIEGASFSGTGETVIDAGALSVPTMGSFSTGTLTLGNDGGVFLIGGGDVPTAAAFNAARTYNQAGGANTWRLTSNDTNNRDTGGGFAGRGSDAVLASGFAGMTDSTLDRNFTLGSAVRVAGVYQSDAAVEIQQNINFTNTGSNNQRAITIAGMASQVSNVGWSLNGTPVNELSGVLTSPGAASDWVLVIKSADRLGSNGDQGGTGAVRISNVNNNFAGDNTSIFIGGNRSGALALPSGRTVVGTNQWDNGGAVAIFTDDAAFGGADEVVVYGGGSSGSTNGAMLLFENRDGGEKTFTRDFFVISNNAASRAAFGSYAGDVRYTGTVTMQQGGDDIMTHVESGTMRLDGATITDDMTGSASSRTWTKQGGGTLVVEDNATFNGTFAGTYNLDLNEGSFIYNRTTSPLTFNDIDAAAGTTFGGSGTVIRASGGNISLANVSAGNSVGQLAFITTGGMGDLQISGTSIFEINGTVAGISYDQVVYTGDDLQFIGGNADLQVLLGYTPTIGDSYMIFDLTDAGSIVDGLFLGLNEGATFNLLQPFGFDPNLLSVTMGVTYQGGTGNDIVLYVTDVQIRPTDPGTPGDGNVVPEPMTGMLAVAGLGGLLLRRRRA